MIKVIPLITALLLCNFAHSQGLTNGGVTFQKYAKKAPLKIADFAVKGNGAILKRTEGVHYKYENNTWHFIRCSANLLSLLMENNTVTQVYFTPSAPRLLNDSTRLTQNIDSVLEGQYPLQESYTGENVIIGFIDDGLDYTHPDFLNPDSTTRVIGYWDQSLENDPLRTPSKYGYGQHWTGAELDEGLHQTTNGNAHGTTVTGAGAGNGGALNGKFKGVAPNADIIMIESDFSRPNWTLTVADAIDYVFAIADSLGKAAVINTSVGDYLGSHDGTDPASQIIDSLLLAKPGRIVVAAAGNSGNWDNYHVRGDINVDTTMTWLEVNPNSAFGFPAVFFDLWADTADFKNIEFAFTAIDTNLWQEVGSTNYFSLEALLNITSSDSIMIGANKASPVQFYCEEVNGVYHIEALFESPDSAQYLYGFNTVGASGTYHLWSGNSAAVPLSKIYQNNLPTVIEFPNIINYQLPDSLVSTVSSWVCSEQVITVANLANQKDYITQNGDNRVLNHTSGKLSINSSKGPNRIGEQKPDISATGDGTLSSCPQDLRETLINSGSSSLAEGQWHVLNGGTSMASPVIAGIAALYLEKCSNATHTEFKVDLTGLANEDNFTGSTPNYAYGHGKVDAFKLLNKSNFLPELLGDTLICNDTAIVGTIGDFTSYLWHNAETSNTFTTEQGDTAYLMVTNERGCRAFSDTLIIVKGEVPISPTINIIGGGLVATPAYAHQWFIDNALIADGNEQYLNPTTTGVYHVVVTGKEGCALRSADSIINIETIKELRQNEFIVFPNPFTTEFQIIKNDAFNVDVSIYDIAGKKIYEAPEFAADDLFLPVRPPKLPNGVYILQLQFDSSFKTIKLIKE